MIAPSEFEQLQQDVSEIKKSLSVLVASFLPQEAEKTPVELILTETASMTWQEKREYYKSKFGSSKQRRGRKPAKK